MATPFSSVGSFTLLAVLALSGCDPGPDTANGIRKETSSQSNSVTATERSSDGAAKAAADAAAAVAAGKLLLKEYPPLPSPLGQSQYVELLKQRCGVDYQVPALPAGVSETEFMAQVRAWNEVMTVAIEKKFGAGILTQLRNEATTNWNKSP
jgi:hypothetical protein